MHPVKYNYRIITLLLLVSFIAMAQAQINTHPSRNFVFKVKLIEEFLERFNLEEDAFLFEEMKGGAFETTHQKILLSLLNHQQDWDTTNVSRFINEVANSGQDARLSFFDEEWFAEVNAKFLLQGDPIEVNLVLKYESNHEGRTQWSLIGVNSPAIFKEKPKDISDSTETTNSIDINKIIQLDGGFIRPASHSINFIDFFRVFKPGNNWDNITPTEILIDRLSYFFALIDFEVLQFIQNNNIAFHFLQIDNWIFQVEYFNRDDANSGWLISNLISASNEEKKVYKEHLIYENK